MASKLRRIALPLVIVAGYFLSAKSGWKKKKKGTSAASSLNGDFIKR